MPLVQLILLACSLTTPAGGSRTECEMIWAGPRMTLADCKRDQDADLEVAWLNAHQDSARYGDEIRSVCMEPML